MRPFSLFFVLISVLPFCSALAQEMLPVQNSDQLVTRFKETSKKTTSIVADFVEEKHGSYLKEPQKSTGVFYYKKSDKLRWEKSKPLKYIFLVNGDKIKIQDNGKEVNVASAKQVVGKIKDLMLTLVNGEFNSGKVFAAQYFENAGFYFVKLIPRNKKLANLYSYIQLSFFKDTLLLKELAFNEKSGDKSIMIFSNSKTNGEISDSVFTNF